MIYLVPCTTKKTMRTRCLDGFSVMWVPKLFLFGYFGPNIGIFAHLVLRLTKKQWWAFRYVGNKTFDFSSKNQDFLPKNDQILPEIGIFVRPCRLIQCPVGGLVGGCGARAVSRNMPIYFISINYFKWRKFIKKDKGYDSAWVKQSYAMISVLEIYFFVIYLVSSQLYLYWTQVQSLHYASKCSQKLSLNLVRMQAECSRIVARMQPEV